nr:mannose-6-phosphate isomerase, class I [Corynebacterium sp. CCUG 71335]
MTGQLQHYSWGDDSSIASLQNREPSGKPEAELWFGAHPSAPSLTDAGPLDAVIAADPARILGPQCAETFSGTLPYLVKILAAAQPLSIQAHPSIAQAREGFARENAAGIPVDAPTRNYKDDNHKPEILIALSPFRALAGFRPVAKTRALIDVLALPALNPAQEVLAEETMSEEQRLHTVLEGWLSLDDPAPLANAVVQRAQALTDGETDEAELITIARNLEFIGEQFPGDVGILAALLLNHVELDTGDGLFLPAGNLHAYISGVGVEVMANSDNVLRGGLTSKHIDQAELLSILEFTPLGDPTFHGQATETLSLYARNFDVGIPDFRVTRYFDETDDEEENGTMVRIDGGEPTIILVVEGTLTIASEASSPLELAPGEAVFIGANEGLIHVETTPGSGARFFEIAPGEMTKAGSIDPAEFDL